MKKGFTLTELLGVIIVLGLIALVIIPVINNLTEDSKEKLYKQQLVRIEAAAKRYSLAESEYTYDNPDYQLQLISVEDLKNKGYLKDDDIKNPLTDEIVEACVRVSNDAGNNQVRHSIVEKNCDTVKTNFLINKIATSSSETFGKKNIGTSNEGYFFFGPNPNNFVRIDNILFRIIKANDEAIYVIFEKSCNNNGCTGTENGSIGTSAFNASNINKWNHDNNKIKPMIENWYNTLTNIKKVSQSVKWCIGGVRYNNPTLTATFLEYECIDNGDFIGLTDARPVGLIRASDYLSTSNSDLCVGGYKSTSPNNRECGKLSDGTVTNFLNKNYQYWTSIVFSNTEKDIFREHSLGLMGYQQAAALDVNVRPVISIRTDVTVKSGSGTENSPYIVDLD